MKYIKKVILENFQSHKYTEIDFDKYLNVIVGPSDQGKTAVIRGIKWALFNEPSGDFFIREGAKDCSVTIVFNDNTKVKRYRSKSKNSYYLYDENGTEMIFEGFGTSVPQEIIDKILIRKVVLDGQQSNAINIGEQLEGPFLLSEKNSTRANEIGRLVGVHIIDDALKDTLKDTRNLNIKNKALETNLEKLQQDLSEYDYLKDLKSKVSSLEEIRLKIYNKKIKLESLNKTYEELNKINSEISQILIYLEKLQELNRVIEIEKELNQSIFTYNLITNRYYKLNSINLQIQSDTLLLNQIKDMDKYEDNIKDIDFLLKQLKELEKLNSNYKSLIVNISKVKYQINLLIHIELAQRNLDLINENYLKYNKLLQLEKKFDSINKSLSIGTVYIEKFSHIDRISNIELEIEEKNKKLNNLIKCKNKMNTLLKEYDKETQNLKKLNIELDENILKYKIILDKIEICPLCFSKIDKKQLDKIIDNYK